MSGESDTGFLCPNIVLGAGVEQQGAAVFAGHGAYIAEMMTSAGFAATAAEPPGSLGSSGDLSTGAHVLSHDSIQQAILSRGITALIPFKTSKPLENLAGSLDLRLLAAPATLTRQIENKLQLATIAEVADVPIPQTQMVTVDENLEQAVSNFGGFPVIFQPAVGYSGRETERIEGVHGIRELVARRAGTIGKITQLLDGPTLTVNAVVVDASFTAVGDVALQITGISECTNRPYGSCGNEYSLAADDERVQRTRSMASSIGSVLAQRGFRGVFGIDVVADNSSNTCFLIEVNARWTASCSFGLQVQQQSGELTLFDAHCAAFSHGSVDIASLRELFDPGVIRPNPPLWSNLVLFAGDGSLAIDSDVLPGTYSSVDHDFRRVGDGWLAQHAGSADDVVLLVNPGQTTSPHMSYSRIHLAAPVLASPENARSPLTEKAQHIVRKTSALLGVAGISRS